MVTLEADNSLSVTVCYRPTYTDQYLQWDSHHNLATKYNVIGTLTHRAKTVCTRPVLFQRKMQHLREDLVKCKYPRWAINKVQNKYINNNWKDNNNHNNRQEDNSTQGNNNPSGNTEGGTTTRAKPNVGDVVITYIQGLGESFKKICGKYGIQTYFKGTTTIQQLLMKPKDQEPQKNKSGVIYSYQCGDIACGEEDIEETSRTLSERYKEHLKQPSPIYVHSQQTGHNSSPDNFSIIGREDQGLAMTIKEDIYIRVNNPTLNRNIGKYNLNYIWDRVRFNTTGLKIGSSKRPVHIHNDGHAQSNPTNGHLQINIGHSGHALNSEHVLRES